MQENGPANTLGGSIKQYNCFLRRFGNKHQNGLKKECESFDPEIPTSKSLCEGNH